MAADQLLLSAVSLISALQLGYLARCVGRSRLKHNISPPTTTGHAEFERTFRAHQNCVEAYLPFLVTLWVSGLFFHEGLAALGGLVFIFARQMYFNGYVTSAKNRLPGFYLTLAAWLTLAALGTVGILHHLLDEYLDINLRKMLFKS
ncbi:microsomal glutathione S-transferase 2 isoform X2 [Scleropages formosus]|uniref:Microsomal glutathione S-transferase 2 n=1 Tax=Scleropages formosus TaxID=113540 RepID=A0A8C9T8Y0_SCLFO|nr:microsomal glutathione S-transferase 2-like isoform X2 [Scleropages formosus]